MARRGSGSASPADDSYGELEQRLAYRFRRPELLALALTHRSFVYDEKMTEAGAGAPLTPAHPSQDNEQLEFLGDAALGLLAAESMCRRFPGLREGELTRLRASVVSRKHLGAVGTRLDLGRWLRLGHTAEKNNGRHNAALFANAVEALIAALYLDGGLEAARRFVEEEVLRDALPEAEPSLAQPGDGPRFSGAIGDYKSALQEMLQARGLRTPKYRLVEESGPAHRRIFHVQVHLAGEGTRGEEPVGELLAAAAGTTKKEAQQAAARLAVAKLAAALATEGSPRNGGESHG
jgi:ribonuclease-3